MTKQPTFEEMEDLFSHNNVEAIAAMSGMLTTQQNIAFSLTALVLEHKANHDLSTEDAKNEIFELYEEASDLVKGQLDL